MGRKYNILVTAVGAIVGYGMVESLRNSGYDVNIIGTDIFPDAVGQYFCDGFIQATPAADSDYIDFLKRTMDEQDIDLVLFGIEQELLKVSRAGNDMDGYRERLAMNGPELTEICNDKWRTFCWLQENGLGEYAIASTIEGSFDEIAGKFGTPFLLKPRDGRASKGIYSVDNAEDFGFYAKKMGESFMAQRITGTKDREYTVGVFGDGAGNVCAEIQMKRTLSQEGATAKAQVVHIPEMRTAVERITAAAKPEGPCNYQFRIENGVPKLLEINPRVSASTSIRAKFGYNESAMCIEYYLEHRMPVQPEIRNGRAMRYITDWVVYE